LQQPMTQILRRTKPSPARQAARCCRTALCIWLERRPVFVAWVLFSLAVLCSLAQRSANAGGMVPLARNSPDMASPAGGKVLLADEKASTPAALALPAYWTPARSYTITSTVTETTASWPAADFPPTRIRIPKIRVDADVVEVRYELTQENGRNVTVWKVADFAAGFHRGSAYPGRAGNTVIAGHNNIRGRVFRYLLNLQPGDDIYLYVGTQEFHYAVSQLLLLKEAGTPEEIQRENARWIEPTEDERLTLVGCWPFIKPDHRVVVIAHPSPGQ